MDLAYDFLTPSKASYINNSTTCISERKAVLYEVVIMKKLKKVLKCNGIKIFKTPLKQVISTFWRFDVVRETQVVYEVVIEQKKIKKCSKAKNRKPKKTLRNEINTCSEGSMILRERLCYTK